MRIFDITLTISPALPVWPGDPPLDLHLLESIEAGAHVNVSAMSASVHLGTHVDAPHHFLNNGRTVEQLPLEVMVGACFVVQLPDDIDEITSEVLEGVPWADGTQRVLFGTSNSHMWSSAEEQAFQPGFVAITEDGARWLVDKGVKLVGIDYLSIAPYGESDATHIELLKAGVVIVEGLDLSQVPRGFYELYCLPLKIAGSDGAPARVILVAR
jgi:arylformamidase